MIPGSINTVEESCPCRVNHMRFRPKIAPVEGILWYIQHHYDLQSGDRLPAERVLCEELGVSRTALRAAITRLISCGTLESRRGSGTYVCPPKPLNIFQETWNLYAGGARGLAQSRPRAWFGFHQDRRMPMRRSCPKNPGSTVGMLALTPHSARSTCGQRFPGIDRDGSRQSVLVPLASRSRF